MADRWNYSAAYGTSRATYVWLPLFVRPTPTHDDADSGSDMRTTAAAAVAAGVRAGGEGEGVGESRVKVLWRDEWRLDDETMYPF